MIALIKQLLSNEIIVRIERLESLFLSLHDRIESMAIYKPKPPNIEHIEADALVEQIHQVEAEINQTLEDYSEDKVVTIDQLMHWTSRYIRDAWSLEEQLARKRVTLELLRLAME